MLNAVTVPTRAAVTKAHGIPFSSHSNHTTNANLHSPYRTKPMIVSQSSNTKKSSSERKWIQRYSLIVAHILTTS